LDKAKPQIINSLMATSKNIFTHPELVKLCRDNKESWGLSKSTRGKDFITFITRDLDIKTIRLVFPSRTFIRYTFGSANIYKIVLSLVPGAYFTHFTALYFHNITNKIPRIIYLNAEQAPKAPQYGPLDQTLIDAAFKNSTRVSRNIVTFQNRKICLLNGMYTNRLGVIEIEHPEAGRISITDLERTLIDITVRPAYSGGVGQVLQAYRWARDKISIDKLIAYLKEMNHVYPYPQAIGFCLDMVGLGVTPLGKLRRRFRMVYDFYLVHQMRDVAYSEKWRLFFPKNLKRY
jgi:hypothetical protein